MNKTIKGIEAGRGIAALLVAVYHISIHYELNFGFLPFSKATEIGHSGVDFFFVLSGFIIFFIHHKDINTPSKVSPYFIKRGVRVYPFYWVMLVATFLLIPFVASADYPGFTHFIGQIFLLPLGMSDLVLGVSWTLQFEILFYLVFAVLIINKKIGTVIASVWLMAILIHNFVSPLLPTTPVILSAFNLQFFMGCFAAFVILKTSVKYEKVIFYLGFVYLFAIFFAELSGKLDGFGTHARVHYGIAFTMIVIGIVVLEQQRYFEVPKFLMLLGKSSYAIYLSHLFFNGIYYKLLDLVGFIAAVPAIVSATLIVCLTVYSSILLSTWVEMPITKKARQYLMPARNKPQ